MAAVVVQIADAVAAALNAATLSQQFDAERLYVPVFNTKDLTTLKVVVVPKDLAATPDTRRSDQFVYGVDVGIQARVDATNAGIDPFMLLAEEVVDLFRGKALAGYPTATCTAVANAPIYDPGHLDEHRVFTSVITLTFTVGLRNRP